MPLLSKLITTIHDSVLKKKLQLFKERNARRGPDLLHSKFMKLCFIGKKIPSRRQSRIFHIYTYTYRIPFIRRYNVEACVLYGSVTSTLATIDMRGSVSRVSMMRTSSRRENRTIVCLKLYFSYL